MENKTGRDKEIGKIIAYLKAKGAQNWSTKDKGALVAAVKMQLTQKGQQ